MWAWTGICSAGQISAETVASSTYKAVYSSDTPLTHDNTKHSTYNVMFKKTQKHQLTMTV